MGIIGELIAMRSVEELCEVLRERGLKITPQRRLIFEALHRGPEHPTADDIYHAVREVMPDMSLATVYHTLNDLAAMGELVELDLGEGKSRYDTSTGEHPHLVCQICRKVEDVPRNLGSVELLPEEISGYHIERCAVVFYGRCPECQSGV
jgi:Fur family peroxide stress response transcriptional regulator